MKNHKFSLLLLSFFLLSACGSSYTIEVNLAPEQVAKINEDIKTFQDNIKNFNSKDGEIDWQNIIDLSNAYEALGQLGKAIQNYEDVVNKGDKTKAILNNLGRLYEKTSQYDKAIVMYQRINEEYFDRDYLYDITWAYIRAKDVKNAEKYFNAWQLEFHKTDLQTQEAIKKLKQELIKS